MKHNTCKSGYKKRRQPIMSSLFYFSYAIETVKAIIPKPLAHRQSQHNNTLLSVSYLPVRSSLP